MKAFKAQEDALLLVWEKGWEFEFTATYEKARDTASQGKPHPFPVKNPCGLIVKANQEVIVEWGARHALVHNVGKKKYTINMVEVKLTIGSKTYDRISIAYEDCEPPLVSGHNVLRPVKKRK